MKTPSPLSKKKHAGETLQKESLAAPNSEPLEQHSEFWKRGSSIRPCLPA